MEKRLTIAELSAVLNISVQATNKKVYKLGLKTTKELINNRLTTIVLLDDNTLNDLILNTNIQQPVKQTINRVEQPVYNEVYKQVDNQFNQPTYEQILNRVLDFTEQTNQEIKQLYKDVSEKDKQIYLLEDSEKRKENEYLKQISELKYENEKLKAENEQLKAGKKGLFGFFK